MGKMQEQESLLEQCISHLENAESLRVTLISQLKDALQHQVARGQIELAKNGRRRLTSPSIAVPPLNTGNLPIEVTRTTEPTPPSVPLTNIPPHLPPPPPPNPATFANSKTNEEESKRSAAAAVAAKLAASTSSAQMLTSVLSSLVAINWLLI